MSLTKKHSISMKTKHTKKNLINQNDNNFSILSFNIFGRYCKDFTPLKI